MVTPNDGSPDQEQLSNTEGIEMLFNSQAFVYWKTPRMHELDETIGDIYGRICDQEFNMANQLREKVPLLHKKGDQQRSGILMSNYFEKIITANF